MLLGSKTQPAYAQETNRAGLVVVDGAGASHAYCVAFAEEAISGYELLQRAGLAVNVEASAMGATICAIDGEGCAFPAESCFCQCQGSPCVYWSYWTLDEEEGWRYETLGAGNTRVRNGDVQGWRWGAGTVTAAEQPPVLTLAEICAAEAAVTPTTLAATTPVGTTPLATTATVAATGAVTLPAAAPATAAVAATLPAGPEAGDLLVWLGIVATPLALGAWLWWRRR